MYHFFVGAFYFVFRFKVYLYVEYIKIEFSILVMLSEILFMILYIQEGLIMFSGKDMDFWNVFWTAISSISSVIIIIITICQLMQQNKRQNELDERQKKIEEREQYQIELNIKQSLFNRRIEIWEMLELLFSSIEKVDKKDLKDGRMGAFLVYNELTNNAYLDDVQSALGTLDLNDNGWMKDSLLQNIFLKKLSNMELLSKKVPLLFSGKGTEEVSNFIKYYQITLGELRKYWIIISDIHFSSIKQNKTFDEKFESYGMEEQLFGLDEKLEKLYSTYTSIKRHEYINQLYEQINFVEN